MGELYEDSVKSKQFPTSQIFSKDTRGTTQLYPLGSRMTDPLTGTEYEYVKSSGIIGANKCCSSHGTPGLVKVTPESTVGIQSCRGVNNGVATADQEYFWMARKGPATVAAQGTGYVLGDLVHPDAGNSGDVDELVVTTDDPTEAQLRNMASVIGHALAAESGGTVLVYLHGK